ncbi:Hypothetical predicted protein [Lecanosticta acicola]|uniref:Uncharacterized protein n=1 Tax=Lecanosticta acicola TaxID=111012 RepID=A0AAI8Z725_9PEZI|nr:Hypothetical predicted protein [Lecanosticta acicola]
MQGGDGRRDLLLAGGVAVEQRNECGEGQQCRFQSAVETVGGARKGERYGMGGGGGGGDGGGRGGRRGG